MAGSYQLAKLWWLSPTREREAVTIREVVYGCEPAGATADRFVARSFDRGYVHDARTVRELASFSFPDAELGHGAVSFAGKDRLLVALPPGRRHPFEPRTVVGSRVELWALDLPEVPTGAAVGETSDDPERWLHEGDDDE